jgi:predicted nuclease with TOPRIM domain
MAETIKFTEDEVSKINQLRQDVANLFTRLGQLQIEKKRRIDEIENLEKEIFEQHQNLVNEEQQIFKELNEKYGDGNYDPNSNEFTPSENTKNKSDEDIKK